MKNHRHIPYQSCCTVTEQQYEIASSQEVNMCTLPTENALCFYIKSAEKEPTVSSTTEITITGLSPNTPYTKWEDIPCHQIAFISDNQGCYTYIQDITSRHCVCIEPPDCYSSITLTNDGWSDPSIGTWDPYKRVACLKTNVCCTIEIQTSNLTLEGNGHTIVGQEKYAGIYLPSFSHCITIRNLTIKNFSSGVYSSRQNSRLTLTNTMIVNPIHYGIFFDIENSFHQIKQNTFLLNNPNSTAISFDESCCFNTIANNKVQFSGIDSCQNTTNLAVALDESSDHNTIINNYFLFTQNKLLDASCFFCGIYCAEQCGNNTIQHNKISINQNIAEASCNETNWLLNGIYCDQESSQCCIQENYILLCDNRLVSSKCSATLELSAIFAGDNSSNFRVTNNTIDLSKNVLCMEDADTSLCTMKNIAIANKNGVHQIEDNKFNITANRLNVNQINSFSCFTAGIGCLAQTTGITIQKNKLNLCQNLLYLSGCNCCSIDYHGCSIHDQNDSFMISDNHLSLEKNTITGCQLEDTNLNVTSIQCHNLCTGCQINSNKLPVTQNTIRFEQCGQLNAGIKNISYQSNCSSNSFCMNSCYLNNNQISHYNTSPVSTNLSMISLGEANSGNIIKQNHLCECQGTAIQLLKQNSSNSINNNLIANSSKYGILFNPESNNSNSIINNQLVDNYQGNIEIQGNEGNYVVDNVLVNRRYAGYELKENNYFSNNR